MRLSCRCVSGLTGGRPGNSQPYGRAAFHHCRQRVWAGSWRQHHISNPAALDRRIAKRDRWPTGPKTLFHQAHSRSDRPYSLGHGHAGRSVIGVQHEIRPIEDLDSARDHDRVGGPVGDGPLGVDVEGGHWAYRQSRGACARCCCRSGACPIFRPDRRKSRCPPSRPFWALPG